MAESDDFGLLTITADGQTRTYPARSPWQTVLANFSESENHSRLALLATGLLAIAFGLADVADAIRDRR